MAYGRNKNYSVPYIFVYSTIRLWGVVPLLPIIPIRQLNVTSPSLSTLPLYPHLEAWFTYHTPSNQEIKPSK
ncbi:hypothetical protein HanRHA438_Chr05g0227871 [Helianthus annuus]|nr:hypothetical protein HanRHA438_Chr05g0227871 [Helianthus annuus]